MQKIKFHLKNIKTIYDIIALYELTLNNQHQELSYEIIKNSVINDLEDSNVTIKTKDNLSLIDILKRELSCISDISDSVEYTDVNKLYSIILNNDKISSIYKEKFNIVNMFPLDVIKDIILSNVSYEEKLNIINDVLEKYDYRTFEKFIRRLPHKLVAELFKINKSEQYNGYTMYNLLCNLINKQKYEEAVSLTEYFDANNEDYCFNLNSKKVSLVGLLGTKKVKIKLIKDLYENKTYMNLSNNIRNNNDIEILSNLNYNNVISFISLSNFNLTLEKINILVHIAANYYKLQGEDPKSPIWYDILSKKDSYYALLFNQRLKILKIQIDTEKQEEKLKQENLRKLLVTTLVRVKEKANSKLEGENPKFKKILQRELTINDLELNKKSN